MSGGGVAVIELALEADSLDVAALEVAALEVAGADVAWLEVAEAVDVSAAGFV
ncbi:MAG: hypothetical protein U0R66_10075 [Mycobacterium sp.]